MLIARLIPMILLAAACLNAADAFIGSWKLNIAKSDFGSRPAAQRGGATYEAQDYGYMYESETVFSDEAVARLHGPVRFDGKTEEGALDGRAVTFVAKRIDANAYEVLLTDKETGKVSHRFRYTVSPDGGTLTFAWREGGNEEPIQKLVYEKQ